MLASKAKLCKIKHYCKVFLTRNFIMANAITSHLKEFDTFAEFSHVLIPGGEWLGYRYAVIFIT